MLDAAHAPGITSWSEELATAADRCSVPSGRRPSSPLAWCVVTTHPQAERRAAASLHRYGFESYLPLVTVRWANRTWHTSPLFPRYLFVRLDLSRPWHPVIAAPGVFQLVTFDGTKPATCSDAVIEAVQDALQAAEAFPAASPLWKPGTPCTMASGPFSGHPAVITQVGAEMATIAILMFGHLREVSVQLDCLTRRDE